MVLCTKVAFVYATHPENTKEISFLEQRGLLTIMLNIKVLRRRFQNF